MSRNKLKVQQNVDFFIFHGDNYCLFGKKRGLFLADHQQTALQSSARMHTVNGKAPVSKSSNHVSGFELQDESGQRQQMNSAGPCFGVNVISWSGQSKMKVFLQHLPSAFRKH